MQNCVECYTSDFVVVRRKFQEYSSSVRQKDESVERLRLADMTPAQEFEVDDTPDASPDYDQVSCLPLDVEWWKGFIAKNYLS